MHKQYIKRLEALQAQTHPVHHSFALWLDGDDDTMIGPAGEVISLSEFEHRYPRAIDLSDTPTTDHQSIGGYQP